MLVGELSRRTGVGAHQLRYYEAQGLLEPDRGANGYREYPEDAVARVNQIRSLIDAGMSTRDIASMMPCVLGEAPDFVSCPELLALMRAREDRLTGQIEALTASREALRNHIGKTVTAGPGDRPWGRGE
ncbi:MerR family transcriptional regulator [Nocardiopsis tropica]|uniref:MerR family transcriptional regulator n=1 Tax=Nocardiopsis tropica TaxID=109330 RepID=A0ABV1ZXB3_9ACTN